MVRPGCGSFIVDVKLAVGLELVRFKSIDVIQDTDKAEALAFASFKRYERGITRTQYSHKKGHQQTQSPLPPATLDMSPLPFLVLLLELFERKESV